MQDPSDVKELARLVSEMRAMQREYFKGRSRAVMAESMALERLVDDAVKEALAAPSLFPRE